MTPLHFRERQGGWHPFKVVIRKRRHTPGHQSTSKVRDSRYHRGPSNDGLKTTAPRARRCRSQALPSAARTGWATCRPLQRDELIDAGMVDQGFHRGSAEELRQRLTR